MKWKIASASARGTSHIRSGRPNQDACEHGTGPQGGALKAVLAVSDGHGGARHFRSEIGSRLAAHIAVSVIQESVPADGSLPDEAVPPLTRKIVEDWRAAVLSDLAQHPFSPEELGGLETAEGSAARASVEEDPALAYGATLLVAAAAETFMVYLQLGDGDILAVDVSGSTTRPLPSDDRLIGNQTTSLCQPDAWKEFRTSIGRNQTEFAAVVLASTDGYANSFRSEEDFLKIGHDYLNLIREDGLDVLAEDLPNILTEASEKGSGDDITLSLMVSDSAYAAPPVVVESTAEPAVAGNAETAAVPAEPRRLTPEYARSERSTAQYKVPESVPPPQRSRFSSAKLRMLALLMILPVGGFLVQHFARPPKKTTVKASSPVSAPVSTPVPKSSEAPRAKEWVLRVGSGAPIPLRLGTKITVGQLFGTEDSKLYADVIRDTNGVLRLRNRSQDPWTVEPPEKGVGVALIKAAKITFADGTVASIALAEVPLANSN